MYQYWYQTLQNVKLNILLSAYFPHDLKCRYFSSIYWTYVMPNTSSASESQEMVDVCIYVHIYSMHETLIRVAIK